MYGVYYFAPRPMNQESCYSLDMTILSFTATELKIISSRYLIMVVIVTDTSRVRYREFNCKQKRSVSEYIMHD